ncbi:hypothetical protein GCM10010278_16780 [Streptomyces melanogenes]|nr:hypothetical protein GCM10010278_16780 [Streptomyces melanogenes]
MVTGGCARGLSAAEWGLAAAPFARCLSAGRPQLVAQFPVPLRMPPRGNPLGGPEGRI